MAMPTLANRWAVLALVFLARLSMAMQYQAIPPIAPLLVSELGINFTQLGLLIGLFMFPGTVLALPGGLLGARFGEKSVVASGLALMLVGVLVLAHSHTFAAAVLGRLLGGVGAVLLNVQLARIVTDWFSGRELALAMGFQLSGWPLGIAMALASLGALASHVSWRYALYLPAGLTLAVLILVLLFYAPLPAPKPAAEKGPARRWTISRVELGLVLVAGAGWMIWTAGFAVFLGFSPLLLVGRNASVAEAGLLVSLAPWVSLASVPLGGWLIDRTGRPVALITGAALLSALAVAWLGAGGNAVLCILLFGFLRGPCAGGLNSLPNEVLAPASRSTGFGFYFTVYYIGMALLPPLAGYLQDRAGGAEAPVLFGAALMAATVGFVLAFRLLERRFGRGRGAVRRD
jgi:MFS family permease